MTRLHGATWGILFAALLPWASAQPKADLPPLPDPRGLNGSILIYGGNEPSTEIVRLFLRGAGNEKAFIVVLAASAGSSGAPVHDQWRRMGAESAMRLVLSGEGKVEARHVQRMIEGATAVWVENSEPRALRDALLGAAVVAPLRRLLLRRGILGGCGDAGALLGMETSGVPGLAVWPQVVIGCGTEAAAAESLLQALKRHPGRVGINLPSNGGLLYFKRRLRSVGAAQPTILTLPSTRRALRVLTLRRGREADLNALSRAAIARTRPPFPPEKTRFGGPAKGTLLAVGGGALSKEIMKRFVAAAGGPSAPIVVIPTAMPDPVSSKTAMVDYLKSIGARNVAVLHARTPEEAAKAGFRHKLRQARGVWFTGGRQWRLIDSYQGGEAHRIMKGILEAGGVIGGSSAGATIQGEYLVRGHPLGNQVMMAEGYERGLGFLQGIAIDQHFTQRNRFKDLERVKRNFPQLLCLGIDESTAVVIKGGLMEVIGKHGVAVYDRPLQGLVKGRPYTALLTGDRYNLRTLKRID